MGKANPDIPNQIFEPDAVDRSSIDTLRTRQPQLYGVLLTVDQKIRQAEGFYVPTWMTISLGLCVAVHYSWLDPLLETDLAPFRNWATYTLITLAVTTACYLIWDRREKRAYQRARSTLIESARRHKTTRYELLTQIENHEPLRRVSTRLARDDRFEDG